MVLSNFESLSEPHIHAKVPRTAKAVAHTDLSREVLAIRLERCQRIREEVGGAINNRGTSVGLRANLGGVRRQFPVGSPRGAVLDAYRETARPAEKAGQVPPANEPLDPAARASAEMPTFSKGHFRNPVELIWWVVSKVEMARFAFGSQALKI